MTLGLFCAPRRGPINACKIHQILRGALAARCCPGSLAPASRRAERRELVRVSCAFSVATMGGCNSSCQRTSATMCPNIIANYAHQFPNFFWPLGKSLSQRHRGSSSCSIVEPMFLEDISPRRQGAKLDSCDVYPLLRLRALARGIWNSA